MKNKPNHQYKHIPLALIDLVKNASDFDEVIQVFQDYVFPLCYGLFDANKNWQNYIAQGYMAQAGLVYDDDEKNKKLVGKKVDGFGKIVAVEKANIVQNINKALKTHCGLSLSITKTDRLVRQRKKHIQ